MIERVRSEGMCSHCKHAGSQHFTAEDSIGYWSFCMLQACECFLEDRDDDPDPA